MNVIKSELYKLKHTWVPWIHILLPIIYALLFWGAAKVTTLKNFSNIYTVIWKPNLGRWSCRNFFPLYRNHFGISHSLMGVPCNKWECFYWSWIY